MRRKFERLVTSIAICIVGLLVGTASAQEKKSTTTETKAFEVISVDGNQLVVRLPEGTKEMTVPETFRFTVNGQQLSVHELKAGMKGTATVTTITTVKPVTVTEVKNGTVMQATGNSAIVRTETGIKMFTTSDMTNRNIRIMKDGKPVDLSDLHQGDHLSALIITEKPPKVMTEKQVTAMLAPAGGAAGAGGAAAGGASKGGAPAMASKGGAAGAGGASGGAAASTKPAAAEAGSGGGGAKHLPKTASQLPLVGLLGSVMLAIGIALTLRRRALR